MIFLNTTIHLTAECVRLYWHIITLPDHCLVQYYELDIPVVSFFTKDKMAIRADCRGSGWVLCWFTVDSIEQWALRQNASIKGISDIICQSTYFPSLRKQTVAIVSSTCSPGIQICICFLTHDIIKLKTKW